MKFNKKTIFSLALSICITGAGVTALADSATNNSEVSEAAMDNHRYMGNISYEEYLEQAYLKGNIPGANQTELKEIYNKIQAVRFTPKYKEFNALWDQFDAIIDEHYVQPEPTCISLEDMLAPAGLNPISDSDYSKMEKIYEEIVSSEKSGNSQDAVGHWEEFSQIYDKYIPTSFIGMP